MIRWQKVHIFGDRFLWIVLTKYIGTILSRASILCDIKNVVGPCRNNIMQGYDRLGTENWAVLLQVILRSVR